MKKTWYLLVIFLSILMFSCSTEKKDWDAVETTKTLEAFQQFLDKHPKSAYALKARSEIEKIYFREAKAKNTIKAYKKFLKMYPKGELSVTAQDLLAEINYKKVINDDTILSYMEFIKKFPKSHLKDRAEKRLQALIDERHSSLRNVGYVKISVTQEFPGNIRPLHLEKFTKSMFHHAGMKVNEDEKEKPALIFRINVKGKAIGDKYSFFGYSTPTVFYTGAIIKGDISISFKENTIFKKKFSGYMRPAKTTSDVGRLRHPSGAPFLKVLYEKSDFADILVASYQTAFGNSILMECFKFGNRYIFCAAIRVLSKIYKSKAEAPLLEIWTWKSNFWAKPQQAAESLKNFAEPWSIRSLILALKNEDRGIKRQAFGALRVIKGPMVVQPFIELLDDDDSWLRSDAAEALGKIKDPRAVLPLIKTTKDSVRHVKIEAIKALKEIKDPRAIPALIDVTVPSGPVGKEARKALSEITGEKKVYFWKEWWSQNKERFVKKNR